MFKYLFVFICSFSLFVSIEIYYPMKKDSKLGEHICRYTEMIENHDAKTYVRPCEEGKYCSSSGITTSGSFGTSYSYYICRNHTNRFSIKVYNEECTSKFDCDTGLDCDNGKCSRYCGDSNWKPYRASGDPSNSIDPFWSCKSTDTTKESFYYFCGSFDSDNLPTCKISDKYDIIYPDYLKVKGTITLNGYYPNAGDTSKGQLYRIKSKESSYIGTVDDGNFVIDFQACKSGFALFFYPDKSLKDPYTGTDHHNNMYLMCVTLIDYDSVNGRVKYSINGDGEKIYNEDQVSRRYSEYNEPTLNQNILIKTELFKKYAEAFNKNLEECQKTENYNEPNTCNVDEIAKWYYFYNNLNNYLFYYSEEEKYEDVIKYLIQTSYPFYQSSKFLNIKYLISLLFLLLI